MDKTKINQRRHYYIAKEFQRRFIFQFCAIVAGGAFLTILILYFLARHSTTVGIAESRVVVRTTADFILPILVQTVTIVLVLASFAVFLVTLFVSHKIAGPLYRFKMVLKNLESGDFSSEVKLRRLDQFQDVADAFNSMMGKNRHDLKTIQKQVDALTGYWNGISERDVSESRRSDLNQIKKELDTLTQTLRHFKT